MTRPNCAASKEYKRKVVLIWLKKPDYVKQADFARSQGLQPTTLHQWIARYKKGDLD